MYLLSKKNRKYIFFKRRGGRGRGARSFVPPHTCSFIPPRTCLSPPCSSVPLCSPRTPCSPCTCSCYPRLVLVRTTPVCCRCRSSSIPPCSPHTCSRYPCLVLIRTTPIRCRSLPFVVRVSLPALGLGLCPYSPAPFVPVSNTLLVYK